jgi:ATP-dependent exoDNAse (exonuclease V) alpha subunit
VAISFARLTVHTRSKGHSAVAASAYRAGVALYDERTGETHDYRGRKDVMYSEVLLPEGASELFFAREILWNKAEFCEKRKDAQICKELTLALPKELALADQIALAKRFAHETFVQHGLAAEIAIHDKLDGNPHAHILVTMRRLEGNQFSLKKARDLNPTFYGKEKKVVFDVWHEKWRDCQNAYFREHNIALSVDEHYLLATRHHGRIHNKDSAHYLKDENKLRQQYSVDQVHMNPVAVLDHLSQR